ncbi:hypothetical protein SPMU_24670 [Sphingomonas mucosissima]|uniref:Uncharacterized protein n=1 Tax=Sphingomonas mucosissima TaxID=370959 RepID=A0A245ZGS1_9SPHN|nr:hypothetical protein SPMU_24670 [Sphingomonas mucosissima]
MANRLNQLHLQVASFVGAVAFAALMIGAAVPVVPVA